MSEAGYASLSPKLLANKGGAKPAMRSQMAAIDPSAMFSAEHLEDLGWNDMGEDEEIQAQPKTRRMGEVISLNDHVIAQDLGSPVHDQQAELTRELRRGAAKANARNSANAGKRAAFTLRLDAQRHLKLRLASTMLDESAQQIVTDALDAALARLPGLDELAAGMKRK